MGVVQFYQWFICECSNMIGLKEATPIIFYIIICKISRSHCNIAKVTVEIFLCH